jgi:CRP-like cAMP-binding protein
MQVQHRNILLSLMDPADLEQLSPFLRETPLYAGQRLYEPGDDVDLVYFPSSCSIAVFTVTADGHCVETASIGFEGAAGLLPAISRQGSPARMIVQIGGGAVALPASSLRERVECSATLTRTILAFFQAAVAQAQQSIACGLVHHLRARLARCLLVCEDRVGRATIQLTQDEMGLMAGALRSSISLAASEFKDAGLIRYSRGHLEILDRAGLEDVACGCYRARRFASGRVWQEGLEQRRHG